MPRFALLLLALACALAPLPQPAQAQVKRCTAADGSLIYTDRQCADIGASERLPSPAAASGGAYLRRNVCTRSVQDLSFALGSAIQSGDANQIAGLYDWAGMGTTAANHVMDRLQVIARRTLVDVQPLYAGGDPGGDDGVAAFDEATGQLIARPHAPSRLVGLRIEQVLGNGVTPSRTVFGLRQRLGCWWVRL